MKKISIIFSIILIFIFNGCNKKIYVQVPTNQRNYFEVVKHSKNKDVAFEETKIWLSKTFNDSKAVIEYENKESGKIVGRGMTKVSYGLGYINVQFTIEIDTKDSKSRLKFENIKQSVNNSAYHEIQNQYQLETFIVEAKKIINDYKTYITKETKNNDW